jgi:TPR repeat protein
MVVLAGAVMLAAASGRAAEDDERRFAEGLEAYDAGDFETAIEAWRPLAEAGSLEAQVSLAEFYLNGLGVAADPAAAAAWYRRAAEAGDPVAQLNLGDLYARGLGVARDPVEAFVWFDLAARQGKSWAAARRDEISPHLDLAQRAEAQARIERYRPSE